MNILVTGGAGYIGSHTIVELLNNGDSVVVVDNLSNSNQESIRRVEKITNSKILFYEIDVRDANALKKIFKENKIDAVIHFAGLKSVGESVSKPIEYYDNNIVSTLVLLETMKKYNVKKLVFSSTAGVYGEPEELPLLETSRIGYGIFSPYGRSKYMIEMMLDDLSFSDKLMGITILRYFNPIGAHSSGLIGEDPNEIPNNLLPYVSQVAIGKLEKVRVYGNDYNTPDGTGVRDYIHVVDLAKGHIAALKHIEPGVKLYNLGTGRGTSVLELIAAFSKAAGKNIPYQIVARRDNDVASSYASPEKANKELRWFAEKSIDEACVDYWRWQTKNTDGYRQC